MTARRIALAVFALATASCGSESVGGSESAAAAPTASCTLDSIEFDDGLIKASYGCTRDTQGLAAAITRARARLKPGGEIALGRVPFDPGGFFDRCAIMARLADDPHWTSSNDSTRLNPALRQALQSGVLAPSIAGALAGAGRRVRAVGVEKVLLSDEGAPDCAKAPRRAPVEAQVWLTLD